MSRRWGPRLCVSVLLIVAMQPAAAQRREPPRFTIGVGAANPRHADFDCVTPPWEVVVRVADSTKKGVGRSD